MNARKWIPALVAVVAVSIFGYGGWLFVTQLRADQASAPQPKEPEGPILVGGKKRPGEFLLPEYPTAFAFRSTDAGPRRGSSAFSVRKGTSKEIAAYYRKRLPELGWEFERAEPAKQRFGEPKDPKSVLLTGTRQFWRERKGNRRLVFLAMDLVRKGTTAQVVMNWFTPAETPSAKP